MSEILDRVGHQELQLRGPEAALRRARVLTTPIATWVGSVGEWLQAAEEAQRQGKQALFVRLALQAYPSIDEQAAIAATAVPFVTVPDRFLEAVPDERTALLKRAFEQHRAARRTYQVEPTAAKNIDKKPSRGSDLTDEERQKYLDAHYAAERLADARGER